MSKSCQDLESLLFEPEEELSDSDSERLANHVAQCEACRAERELFLDSWSALDNLEPDCELEAPCSHLRAKVWEQIREEQKQAPAPLIQESTLTQLRTQLQRLAVAGIALLLGFGLGRGIRPEAVPSAEVAQAQTSSQEFLDPDLLELASQDGFSVEIFPESKGFSPLDQEAMSALAPNDEARTWVQQKRGSVLPVQYISQQGLAPR